MTVTIRPFSRQRVTPQVAHDRDDEPRGLCADDPDPDIWFSFEPVDQERAKSVCRECPFITTCLAAAMDTEGHVSSQGRYGIWGALDPEERASLSLKRQNAVRRQKQATIRQGAVQPQSTPRDPREVVDRARRLAESGASLSAAARAIGYSSVNGLRGVLVRHAPDVAARLAASGRQRRVVEP